MGSKYLQSCFWVERFPYEGLDRDDIPPEVATGVEGLPEAVVGVHNLRKLLQGFVEKFWMHNLKR